MWDLIWVPRGSSSEILHPWLMLSEWFGLTLDIRGVDTDQEGTRERELIHISEDHDPGNMSPMRQIVLFPFCR